MCHLWICLLGIKDTVYLLNGPAIDRNGSAVFPKPSAMSIAKPSIPAIDTPSQAAETSRSVTVQSLASSAIMSAAIFVVEVVIFLLLRRDFTAL